MSQDYKIHIDNDGYAIAIVANSVTGPEYIIPPDYTIIPALYVPKWDGIAFLEGYDTATITQRMVWMGEQKVKELQSIDYYANVAFDVKGRIGITQDPRSSDDDIQWRYSDIVSSGGGNTDIFDIVVPEDLYFKSGGIITLPSMTLTPAADRIDVDLVDIDNVLGYGPNLVLHRYIDNFPVIPDKHFKFYAEGTELLLGGLYFRFTYRSAALSAANTVIIERNWRI